MTHPPPLGVRSAASALAVSHFLSALVFSLITIVSLDRANQGCDILTRSIGIPPHRPRSRLQVRLRPGHQQKDARETITVQGIKRWTRELDNVHHSLVVCLSKYFLHPSLPCTASLPRKANNNVPVIQARASDTLKHGDMTLMPLRSVCLLANLRVYGRLNCGSLQCFTSTTAVPPSVHFALPRCQASNSHRGPATDFACSGSR